MRFCSGMHPSSGKGSKICADSEMARKPANINTTGDAIKYNWSYHYQHTADLCTTTFDDTHLAAPSPSHVLIDFVQVARKDNRTQTRTVPVSLQFQEQGTI